MNTFGKVNAFEVDENTGLDCGTTRIGFSIWYRKNNGVVNYSIEQWIDGYSDNYKVIKEGQANTVYDCAIEAITFIDSLKGNQQ